MVKFTMEQIREIMDNIDAIRNMSVIAHVDHGKSTLTDSLISRAGIIARERAGEARYTDTREDEQARSITIKSTGVTLYYELSEEDMQLFEAVRTEVRQRQQEAAAKAREEAAETDAPVAIVHEAELRPLGKRFLINLIDSPGHVDFSSEVTAALRITDGALVVVDSVEGVCVQTETVLRQALSERIKPVLMINKVDRLLTELDVDPEEAYGACRKVIEDVNITISIYNDEAAMGPLQVAPDQGTVAFGSGLESWGFTLLRFARMYADKFGVKIEKLMRHLWGDWFWDAKAKKWRRQTDGKLKRGFVQFVWEPIRQVTRKLDRGKIADCIKMLTKLQVSLPTGVEDMRGGRLMKEVMSTWLPAADALLEMIVLHLPSPREAQSYRMQTLYTGPKDDLLARSIATCDASGPVCVYVSKMVPAPDGARFFAFGRVFSGTVRAGLKVNILGPRYKPGAKTDLFANRNLQRVVLMMGRYQESITDVPAGNLVGLMGVDQYLVKSGTITTFADAFSIAPMRFSVSPVVRVAVETKHPADLPKLIIGLQRLSKSDPCVQYTQEESGEHIIAGVGELHLEICLKDLGELSGVPIRASEPVVSYRETVTAESSETCLSKSPNKHNRLWVRACPLKSELVDDLEEGKLPDDVKLRARYLADNHAWDPNDGRKLWAFGPVDLPYNCVVDQTKAVQYLHEVQDSICTGFQWVTRAGVLCEERCRGMRFNVLDVTLHPDAIHRGGGQIIPTARRVFYAAQMTAAPRFMEPVFQADIQVPEEQVGGIYTVVTKRRGRVLEQNRRQGTPLLNVRAYLPVMESFGFTPALRAATSGQAFPQLLFSHWALIEDDPMEEGSMCHTIMIKGRERKGLKLELPQLDRYVDRL